MNLSFRNQYHKNALIQGSKFRSFYVHEAPTLCRYCLELIKLNLSKLLHHWNLWPPKNIWNWFGSGLKSCTLLEKTTLWFLVKNIILFVQNIPYQSKVYTSDFEILLHLNNFAYCVLTMYTLFLNHVTQSSYNTLKNRDKAYLHYPYSSQILISWKEGPNYCFTWIHCMEAMTF